VCTQLNLIDLFILIHYYFAKFVSDNVTIKLTAPPYNIYTRRFNCI